MKWLLPVLFVFTLASVVLAQADNPAICPTISIDGPARLVNPGETATYAVQIDSKGLQLNPQYLWSVSPGQILNGQGTTSVDVQQTREALTVTVEIKGLPDSCPNTASATEIIDPAPQAVKIDEMIGPVSGIDKSRLDKITKTMRENPNAQLVIFLAYKGKAGFDERSNRRQELAHYLNLHTDEDQRITYVFIDGREIVQFWLVPPGAEMPKCKECEEFSVLTEAEKCPSISVIGPTGRLSPGGVAIFTANLNSAGRKITYQWTISKGEIEDGQGTNSISVHIPAEALNINALATVRVEGLAEGCTNTGSTEYSIGCGACDPRIFDEYGNLHFADERARLDRFAKEVLSANNATGYIIRSFSKRVSPVIQQKKMREMKEFLFVVRKYPKKRFVVLLGAPGRVSTKLYIVPPDPNTGKPVDIDK